MATWLNGGRSFSKVLKLWKSGGRNTLCHSSRSAWQDRQLSQAMRWTEKIIPEGYCGRNDFIVLRGKSGDLPFH